MSKEKQNTPTNTPTQNQFTNCELKPCPFCGGEVELKDHTSNLYGFNGYEVRCKCGCGVKSHLCSEMRCQGNKISTPVTESGKAKALTDLVNLWNNAGYRKQEWISVDERLPDNDWGKHWKERKYYLVFTKPSGLMNVAVYGYKEHNWWIDRNSCVLDEKNYKKVTHWMPLPEAPKMKGGE